MADIFREVDEDLRQQQFQSLWRKYGKFLIAALVILVIAVAGIVGWRHYWQSKNEADSIRFGAAFELLSKNKTVEAAKAFADIQATGTPGYAYLAGLQSAQAEVNLGHPDKAVAIYNTLASHKLKDPFLADYASLLAIMYSVDTGLTPDMTKRLAALAEEGKPWSLVARQLQAVAAYKAGRADEARDILASISEDVEAPQTVRDRAQELASVIGAKK